MVDSLTDVLARLRSCEWIDLTHAFGPGIPHYFAFPDEERETLFHFDEGVGSAGTGFLAHRFTHIGQWGTHVDPPAHFTRGGRFLDELPVTDMILPLVVVDVRRQVAADVDHTVTVADLEAHEAEHGEIPAGAFVALLTGWADRWPDGEAMANRDADGLAHYPGWGVDALTFLVEERGVDRRRPRHHRHRPGRRRRRRLRAGRDLHPRRRQVADRDAGRPRPGAGHRCARRRDLAQAAGGLGLPGAGLRDRRPLSLDPVTCATVPVGHGRFGTQIRASELGPFG